MSATPRVLILVENLSVPFDRRVWQECQALRDAVWDVNVICPMGTTRDTEPEAVVDGVKIYRYPLRIASGGPKGYLGMRFDKMMVREVVYERNYSSEGLSVSEIARRQGKDQVDAFLDLAVDEDLNTLFAVADGMTAWSSFSVMVA